jgi:hypothetical protein
MASKTNQPKMITAVFRDRFDAIDAFEWLQNRGYRENQLSVLMSDQTRTYLHEQHEGEKIKTGTKVAEGVATGGAIGTAVGAGLAALAAVGTSLILPGLGLVIAGPLAVALAGGGAGAVAGGLIGGLVGLGIPESNAKAYEEALKNGGVAIGVVPNDRQEANLIREEFERLNGENIITT